MIDEKLLNHLAKLAGLELQQGERESFQKSLDDIVGYFSGLAKVDTENFNKTHTQQTMHLLTPKERCDEVASSIGVGFLKDQAPSMSGTSFRVPPIIEN